MTQGETDALSDYLVDLGAAVKQRAYEAKEEKRGAADKSDVLFQMGRLMAFNEVITLMQLQADAFGISRSAISLDDVDPDKDLV